MRNGFGHTRVTVVNVVRVPIPGQGLALSALYEGLDNYTDADQRLAALPHSLCSPRVTAERAPQVVTQLSVHCLAAPLRGKGRSVQDAKVAQVVSG